MMLGHTESAHEVYITYIGRTERGGGGGGGSIVHRCRVGQSYKRKR